MLEETVAEAGDRIVVKAEPMDSGQRRVPAADSGPGIAPGDLPHLFDRFFQSRQGVAPATGEGGKGRGLAIVKRIAELHQGDVAVTSMLGKGTRVTIELPAATS